MRTIGLAVLVCLSACGKHIVYSPDGGPRGERDAAFPRDAADPRDADATDIEDASTRPLDDIDAAAAVLDATCDALAEARCVQAQRCGCVGEHNGVSDVDLCVTTERIRCRGGAPALAAELGHDGEHAIDTASIDACEETLRGAYVDCVAPPPLEALSACRRILASRVPIDGACRGGFLCAGGAGHCQEGVCRALASALGAPCEEACGGSLSCVGGACDAPRAIGEACADHEDCAPPSLCHGGRCGALSMLGEACVGDASCRAGLSCLDGVCRDQEGSCREGRVCPHDTVCISHNGRRCVPERARGEHCVFPYECMPGDYCAGDDTCRRIPDLGEPCDFIGDCLGELACSWISPEIGQRCVVPAGLGESCDGPPCAPGLVCDVDGWVCEPPRGLGEPCSLATDCVEGTTCHWDTMRCGEPLALGQRCDRDGLLMECAPGSTCVVDLAAEAAHCRGPAGLHERCEWGRACSDGLECIFAYEALVSVCRPPAPAGGLCGGACAAPGEQCGEVTAIGSCEPAVCDLLRDRAFP